LLPSDCGPEPPRGFRAASVSQFHERSESTRGQKGRSEAMSVFPRHLCALQTVHIHARVSPSQAHFALLQTAVRDPHDRIVFEDERQMSAAVPPGPREQPAERRLAEGLCETPPLLFVSQCLRGEEEARAELVGLLHDIGRSVHFYFWWTVPETAALGCYRVEITLWVDGQRFASRTARNDKFFVERLSLESCRSVQNGIAARIRNHSPEPARARLHEYAKGRDGVSARIRALDFGASAETEVFAETDRSVIVYAEDGGMLWLAADGDPSWIRDQTCAWMSGRHDTIIVSASRTGKSYTLKDTARAIWLGADGTARESQLRALGSDAFDALVTAGLLRKP
jgi:hypothetical protein